MPHEQNPYETPPTKPTSQNPSAMREEKSSQRPLRDTFRSGTPDDVRNQIADKVAKGVAAFAGALKGFTDEARQSRLSETTRDAIRDAGDTAKSGISETTKKVREMKQPLKEAGQKMGSTMRDVAQTGKQELQQTRDTVRGGSNPSNQNMQSGMTSQRRNEDTAGSMPMDMPDLNKSELGTHKDIKDKR